jgi:hypothetical protein
MDITEGTVTVTETETETEIEIEIGCESGRLMTVQERTEIGRESVSGRGTESGTGVVGEIVSERGKGVEVDIGLDQGLEMRGPEVHGTKMERQRDVSLRLISVSLRGRHD